jgi:hypothetical protein
VDWTGGEKGTAVFDCLYLGERAVTQHKGVEVVTDVMSQLNDYDLIGSNSGKLSSKESSQLSAEIGAVLVVSKTQVISLHKARREVMHKDSIGSITFFTIIPPDEKSIYETIA